MTVDLLLKGGKIATSTGVTEADIAVDQGKIVAISKETNLPKADKVLDVSGLFVLPGIIDAHVHVCDPGFIRESFRTGTAAAAAGGVTTIIDMASSAQLRTSSVAMLSRKKEIAQKESFVDFGLYGGEIADEKDLVEIGDLVKAGVVGFGEIMMCGDMPVKNDEILLEAFRLISKAKSVAAVHAEDNSVLTDMKQRMVSKGRKDVMAFADSRPNEAEAQAIAKALILSRKVNVSLHVCHLSTREGLSLIQAAKARGLHVTTEVCPHHLFFTRDSYSELGPYIVTTPPLRTKYDAHALWNGLYDGTVDLVVSDHCAFKKKEKDVGLRDVWKTPPGVPGLETLALVMLGKGVNEGKISLERFVKASAENPAKIFGLYPKKGVLQQGADADIVVFDLHKQHRIKAEDMKCVADYTPYEGWVVAAEHVVTLVRGRIVAKEGEVVGKMGYGAFVKPSLR
jgi:D-hydantoinase